MLFQAENKEKLAEEITKVFFEKLGGRGEWEDFRVENKVVFLRLKAEEPEILIGKGGAVLRDIQYLLSKMVSKKTGERFFIDLDINRYKEKKSDYLREMAKEVAAEAILLRQEKELPPMPSDERRIIHLALAGREDVVAESVGEEPWRRIVIKPAVQN